MLLFMIQAMKPVVNSPLLGPDIIQRNIQQLMFLFLDAVNIQIYNAENETDYKLLPDNCFKSWKHQHWRLKIPITTKR